VKLTVMVEPQTVEGIERLRARMQAAHRSMRVDRSTAAREALTLGLEQAGCVQGQDPEPGGGQETPKKRPSRKGAEHAA
jgi:hypothetical protein